MSPKTLERNFTYYDFNKVMSYQAVFNFVTGSRGRGKTYGAKKFAIKRGLHTDEQFIYMRRWKTELEARYTFFADIAGEFLDWDLKVEGHKALAAHVATRDDKKRRWKTIGFFVALSTAQAKKSVSYHTVTTIIYDEFIIDKGVYRYLPKEVKAFNEFYSTVDRWKDKTRVFFLANAVSIMNPYYLEYNIKPDELPEYSVHGGGFICCHFDDSDVFADEVKATRFGSFIHDYDPDYVDYSVHNKFADNHQGLVRSKPSDAKYRYTLETKTGIFSVWLDWSTQTYYIREQRPKQEMILTLILENVSESRKYVTRSNKLLQYMRTSFNNGKMYFDSPKERNAFTEVFRQQ